MLEQLKNRVARIVESAERAPASQPGDEENIFLPWPEWREYQKMTPEQKHEFICSKLTALLDEIKNRGKV